jgi:hypothetical protein
MSTAAKQRGVTRWVVGGIAAVACLILVLLSYPRGFIRTEREPTEHEGVLYFFAARTGEPALCEPISWDAFRRYYDFGFGRGASFFRSDCYEAVAGARGDPDVCWAVRPLVDFELSSNGYSALSCRRRVRQRVTDQPSPLDDDTLVHTFEGLGYNVDELYREDLIGPPVIDATHVYIHLADNSTAIARGQALLRGPNTLDAEDAAYLADMVAISTSQPEWCERIRTDIVLSGVPFRDWCLRGVAANTHDPGVCDRIRPAAKARCRWDARYSPRCLFSWPTDQQQTLRLISALGVAMPSPRDWPVHERADIFNRFLIRLAPRQWDGTTEKKDAAHQAARSELVQRLLRHDNR